MSNSVNLSNGVEVFNNPVKIYGKARGTNSDIEEQLKKIKYRCRFQKYFSS